MLRRGIVVRNVEGRVRVKISPPLHVNILIITQRSDFNSQEGRLLFNTTSPTNSWIYYDISVQTSPCNSSRCPSTRPSNDKPLTLKLQHFIFSNQTSPMDTFILRAQNSHPKLPINVSTMRMTKSAHIIPTNLISTLHILFYIIITYFICLYAIKNPIMIGYISL